MQSFQFQTSFWIRFFPKDVARVLLSKLRSVSSFQSFNSAIFSKLSKNSGKKESSWSLDEENEIIFPVTRSITVLKIEIPPSKLEKQFFPPFLVTLLNFEYCKNSRNWYSIKFNKISNQTKTENNRTVSFKGKISIFKLRKRNFPTFPQLDINKFDKHLISNYILIFFLYKINNIFIYNWIVCFRDYHIIKLY